MSNTDADRWDFLVKLDDELLLGGAMITESTVRISREADVAFAKGCNVASILTAVAAIESHLRDELQETNKTTLAQLIDAAGLSADLTAELHALRRFRNTLVHTQSVDGDDADDPAVLAAHEAMATSAARSLRRVLYSNPLV